MSDKVREQNLYSFYKAKYKGIGNENTTKEEFVKSYEKDVLNSVVQHNHLLTYNAIAKNKNPKLYKVELLHKMSEA